MPTTSRPGATSKGKAVPLYAVHPSIAHMDAIVRNLPETTGKTVQQWTRLLRTSGLKTRREQQAWLKKEFGLGATTVSVIALFGEEGGAEEIDPRVYLEAAPRYVDRLYAGPKAALRPLHDALIELGRSLGPDVQISPCKTMVPLYRRHVFAQVRPATRARIDLGLALKGAKKRLPRRLQETGGLEKGDRITHRIALESPEEIDAGVRAWLMTAYELDG